MAAQIFVVSGASGSGKTTLVRALQERDPQLRFSVSYTTRPRRPGEIDGKDYCFISTEEFLQMIRENLLVEYVEQFGHYYGTSRSWIEQALQGGRDILFDVEINGAKAIRAHCPEGNFIFILPPNPNVLETRLRSRGSLPEPELQERLARVRQEVQEIGWYDYLVVNDHLEEAVIRLQCVVTAARCRTQALWPQLQPQWA